MANRSQMLSAGVYPNEVDNSIYTSTTMSTTTGIVGVARRGPLEPTLITSEGQLITVFGTPEENFYGLHAAIAILDAGGPVVFQRVVHTGSNATAGTSSDPIIVGSLLSGADSNNLKVEIKDVEDPTFTLEVKYKDVVREVYNNLVLESGQDNSVDTVVNSQSAYVTVKVNKSISLAAKVYELSGGVDDVAFAKGAEGNLSVKSRTYDSTLNGSTVIISAKDALGHRDYQLKHGATVLEEFRNLSDDPNSDRYLERFINKSSEFIEITITDPEEFKSTKVTNVALNGGKDGIEGLTNYDVVGQTKEGLKALSDTEIVQIRTLIAPGFTDHYVISSGIAIAESRGDCQFIFDGEEDFTPQQIVNWANGVGKVHDAFDSSYGALYYPWVKVYDKYAKKEVFHPSAGYVAAQYVVNDTVGEVYDAPAGLQRGVLKSVIGVKHSCSKLDRDILYGNRNIVNPIASLIGKGIVIWGQKTCQRTPSVFDRLNNRRLANYLMHTITDSTMSLVFEGNHSLTWDRWKSRVEPILDRIKADKGISDYRLVMDESSITIHDMENHIMPGKILIKYTNTAEFIPLDFVAVPTSTEFDE